MMKNSSISSMEIHDEVLPSVLSASLLELWESDVMCDVVLSVGGQEIKAHKVVLAASSPYFRAMFSTNLKESLEHRVQMHDVEFNALYDIINFLYSTKLKITEDNVYGLLILSDILQITAVRSACSQFVLDKLSLSSCLSTLYYTHLRPDYRDVTNETLKFIWNNMSEVMKEEDFFLLPHDIMQMLMEGNIINVADEGVLLSGIIQWVSHSPGDRLQYLEELASGIQLTHVPTKTLLPLKQNPLLEGTLLQQRINKTFDSRLEERLDSGEARSTWAINFTEKRRSLRYAETQDVILAVGGETSSMALSSMECLANNHPAWKCVMPKVVQSSKSISDDDRVIATMRQGRCAAAVAYSDDKIVVVGGSNFRSLLDSVEAYSIHKNEWKYLPSIPTAVTGAQCAFMNGQLYVTGGYTSDGIEKRCWVLDESMRSWTEFASMNEPRCFHGLVCIAGYLYAFGGRDDIITSNSVERYDPALKRWVNIAPMSTARSDFGCVAVDHFIYVIAGFNGNFWTNLCEKYDTRTNTWTNIAHCPDVRSSCGVTVSKKIVYVLGGYNSLHYLNNVQKYNTQSDRWHCSVPMQVRRSSLGAATARIPVAAGSDI